MEEQTRRQMQLEIEERFPDVGFDFKNMKKSEILEWYNKPKNPLAYPMYNELGEIHEPGMTLRDYFAAMAMQGIVISEDAYEYDNDDIADAAEQSYQIADAMLKARIPNKKQ